jgi:hypothetical protein
MSESVHVNFSFSGPVILQKKKLNDPTLFWHFCNYLRFEEDLVLYLNKLEFALPKNNLC